MSPRPVPQRPTPEGRRRGTAPFEIYGLPLPDARHGVASVVAIGGTGRLWAMARRFGPQRLRERSDLARISADLHANLDRLDGLDAITGPTGPTGSTGVEEDAR